MSASFLSIPKKNTTWYGHLLDRETQCHAYSFAIQQPTPAISPWLGSYFRMCAPRLTAELRGPAAAAVDGPTDGPGSRIWSQASRGLREYEMCATSLDTPFSASVAGECCECSQRHVQRVISLDSTIKKGRPAVVDTFLFFIITNNIIDLHPRQKINISSATPLSPVSLSDT